MKIVCIFLFGLGMLIAPEAVSTQVWEQCFSKIVEYSFRPVDRKSRQVYESDDFLKAHTTVEIDKDDNLDSSDYGIKTPFGSVTVSPNSDLSPDITSGIYELDKLQADIPVNSDPDVLIKVTIDGQEIQGNMPPHNSIRRITIDLEKIILENGEYPCKFSFQFCEPGTYKLKDLLFAMAKLTKNIHEMIRKHNRVLDIKQLDKSNPAWLARMKYDCATIVHNMMNNIDKVGPCLRSNIIRLKLKSSTIGSRQYYLCNLSNHLNSDVLMNYNPDEDTHSDLFTLADYEIDLENQEFKDKTFQIFDQTLCKNLGVLPYPFN